MTLRPVLIQSLDHLAALMAHAPSVSSSGSPATTATAAPGAARKKAPPHPPSRLSQSIYFSDTERDTDSDPDLERGAQGTDPRRNATEGTTGRSSGSSRTESDLLAMDIEAAEMYTSTIEFLSLMTAFVSVVCWLMQARLKRDTSQPTNLTLGIDVEDVDMENRQPIDKDCFERLNSFLLFFDDHDNVLKPIQDALYFEERSSSHGGAHLRSTDDPTRQVGLFAWHFSLFSGDEDGPLQQEVNLIDRQALDSIHFDVILNDLYSTHVLAMTAKEHQKDHGQFYTPSNVVDFMWRRAIVGRENLLERFVANLSGLQDQGGANQASKTSGASESSLVPTALDPCLGVSTFLSCYIRLLIQQARQDHTDTIWNSPTASRLLLAQICENIWGIELDGFAFWMARCGILASLIPLVERVQELQYLQQQGLHYRTGEEITKLNRLHLFRNDTLQLTVPDGVHPDNVWERTCILQLRDPQLLRFDFIVTNPPYMIRKTGTFSAPDPEVYDWSILETGGSPTVNISNISPSETGSRSKPRRGSISPNPPVNEETVSAAEEEDELEESDSEVTTPGSTSTESPRLSRIKASQSPSWSASSASASMRLGAKGMMQAYGYFIWFAAQRIKPYAGVSCMITGMW